MPPSSPFVDTNWLAAHLSSPDVCIVDSSWHLPNTGRDARSEFLAAHIPGAVHFDLDLIADTSLNLPHMVAPVEIFSKMVGDLGIRETNTIIVYDSAGLFSAARVWWNFKIMGAQNCYVLEGGLPKWLMENRPIHQGDSLQSHRPFHANPVPNQVVDKHVLLKCIQENAGSLRTQIVDVRSNMRFAGLEVEPRPGLRSGYMPTSINLPFVDLIENGQFIENNRLMQRMEAAGIDLSLPIISTCGSGVTAPLLSLALAELGIESMRVYDGSWAEWGMQGPLPVLGADGLSV
ncbi:MAG: sulfurtransferase [Devosiaceae bacterium]|nr:sulfurtransferase [Devosiaceae bacterium]